MAQMQPIDSIVVGEAMSGDFGYVDPDTTVEKVIDLMLKKHWGEVLIDDPDHDGQRIVTKEHLIRCVDNGFPTHYPIKELGSKETITTNVNVALTAARDVMRKHKIGRLPVLDIQGTVVGMLTARDVCNGFSSKLEMLGEHMYSILDNINEAIHVVDCDGRVVFWNRSAERLFGMETEDILGQDLKRFLPDDISLKVIESLDTFHNYLHEIREGVYVVSNAVPVRLPQGNIIGAVCTTLDVSPLLTLMEQLDKAKMRVKNMEKLIDPKYNKKELFYTTNVHTLKMLQQARRVAKTRASVLIQGESGTGKELLANVIYENSKRRDKAFIAVNCSAIPSSLFESEMFGYEAGSFTGGSKGGKPGKFELAHGGTVFLDEVGELPLDMQAKLLRVIQEKKFYRVGGTRPVEIDIRLIAATNRDLAAMVAEGKFREDLYYRLDVVTLRIPPLRQRKEDIPGLVERFLQKFQCLYEREIKEIDKSVMKLLVGYYWPGNVRQLHNLLESVLILTEENRISIRSLEEAQVIDVLQGGMEEMHRTYTGNSTSAPSNLDEFMLDKEREVILKVLGECNNNKVRAAQRLGIPRSTLYYKIKTLGLQI